MEQKIIVFGRGRYFHKKKKAIEEQYKIVGFVDNAVKVGKMEWEEQLPVYNPQEINRFANDTLIIIASVKFYEMWKQLLDLEVKEERILFGITFSPRADAFEDIFHDCEMKICSKNRQIVLTCDKQEVYVDNEEQYKEFFRNVYYERFPYIKAIADMPLIPVSRRFALERGKAIDRVYIEKFLETYKRFICGDVMEIAEKRYTRMYGEKNVNKTYALHINGWGEGVIKGNLATGEGITENMVDCLICTQTIFFIYDIHNCVKNIYKLLKPEGRALITCSLIAPIAMYDYENWGEYWRFTDQSLRRLFEECFDSENIEIISYGNMKTAIAFLYGLCAEDLPASAFEFDDKQYPMIVAAVVKK